MTILAAHILVGCGGEKVEPEPQASQESAQTAASGWTEEQKAAFKTAHERARSGADNDTNGTPGKK